MRNLTSTFAKTMSTALLFLLLVSPVGAAPADPTVRGITVGDFLVLYARSIHVVLPADATPGVAYEALKAAGSIPADPLTLEAPLTHEVLLRIGKTAGLKLTSKTPERELARPEAEYFLQSFSPALAAHCKGCTRETYDASFNPPGNPAGRANTSKGKKKGRPFQSQADLGGGE